LFAWASARGGKTEIGSKKQTFLENLKPAAKFRLIDIILAMTVDLPV